MKSENIIDLIMNGLKLTNHAKNKMIQENISVKDIYLTLLSGKNSNTDTSTRNNKEYAWNIKPHQTVTFNNLTVVFVVSRENYCLIISVYHGFPHHIRSNPYNNKIITKIDFNQSLKVVC